MQKSKQIQNKNKKAVSIPVGWRVSGAETIKEKVIYGLKFSLIVVIILHFIYRSLS